MRRDNSNYSLVPLTARLGRLSVSLPGVVGNFDCRLPIVGTGGPLGNYGFAAVSKAPDFTLFSAAFPLARERVVRQEKLVSDLQGAIQPELDKLLADALVHQIRPEVDFITYDSESIGALRLHVVVGHAGGVSDSPLELGLRGAGETVVFEAEGVSKQKATESQGAVYSQLLMVVANLPGNFIFQATLQSPYYSVRNYETTDRRIMVIPEERELAESSNGFTAEMFEMVKGVAISG